MNRKVADEITSVTCIGGESGEFMKTPRLYLDTRAWGCGYSRASARRWAVCSTLTLELRLSRPPRICMTQPGQSMSNSGAPVCSMFISLRSRIGADSSGSVRV